MHLRGESQGEVLHKWERGLGAVSIKLLHCIAKLIAMTSLRMKIKTNNSVQTANIKKY